MLLAIIDTSVYIGHFERGLYAQAIDTVLELYAVRHSAVVLAELRRGARTRRDDRLVERLRAKAVVEWAPMPSDWWEAGGLIRRIATGAGWDPNRRRAFQNDALIALTARRYGATVVTADADFLPLARALGIRVTLLE